MTDPCSQAFAGEHDAAVRCHIWIPHEDNKQTASLFVRGLADGAHTPA